VTNNGKGFTFFYFRVKHNKILGKKWR